jgi:hypothetical protein
MDKTELLNLIELMLDPAANGDGAAADRAGIWNNALISLGRKVDVTFHNSFGNKTNA